MRNYIILNGQNSNNINGLLIQSLPPITKPLIRTQVEEIDGRDGDIVTKLGFSSYNKEFTVGLYGNYDVDEVIGYFNSEGVVTFSNEPDKYYKYQILEQIDFEKLIRFKTATVKMHCQPFKYSATETPAIFENVENLVSIPDFTKTTNGITVGVENGVISVRGTGSAATEFYIPITSLSLSAGDYVMRALGSGTSPEACSVRVIYNSPSSANSFGGTYAMLQNNTTVSIATTLTENKTYNYIYLYINPNVSLDFTLDLRITVTEGLVAGEGNNIHIQDTSLALFKSFGLKGDTKQTTYSGKNLLRNNYGNAETISGVTFTKNPDGTITANGTATAGINYYINGSSTRWAIPEGTYTLSTGGSNGTSSTYFVFIDGSSDVYWNSAAPRLTQTVPSGGLNISPRIVVRQGQTLNNVVFKPMLEQGSTATSFEPYVGGIPAPNPNYPQNVRVVTGEQTMKVIGKNLLRLVQESSPSQGITATVNSDGSITVSGTASSTWADLTNASTDITLSSGGTYTFSINKGLPVSIGLVTSGVTRQDFNIAPGRTSVTATANYDNTALRLYIFGLTQNQSYDFTIYPQFEKGSSATTYEPFQSQTYTVDLGSIELCKIGSYQDYIYKSGDDWYVHKAVEKIVAEGSEGGYNGTNNWYWIGLSSYGGANTVSSGPLFSNRFTFYKRSDFLDTSLAGCSIDSATTLLIRNTDCTSTSDYRTWLASNNVTFYYPLGTPTDTKITDETLLSQLEPLASQAYSYIDVTNLISKSTSLPVIMSVQAIKEDKATIINSGNTIARPILTIYGTGDIGVHLNGFQVFTVALGDEGYITIDTNLMEAYKDTPNNLKNRLVDGDYTNFVLVQGESEIAFSGLVNRCVIENYSRWL